MRTKGETGKVSKFSIRKVKYFGIEETKDVGDEVEVAEVPRNTLGCANETVRGIFTRYFLLTKVYISLTFSLTWRITKFPQTQLVKVSARKDERFFRYFYAHI